MLKKTDQLDETYALAAISSISPKMVEITFVNALPYFMNEEFAKSDSNQEYYLTVAENLELHRNKLDEMALLAYQGQKYELKTYTKGPLIYFLENWQKEHSENCDNIENNDYECKILTDDKIHNKILTGDKSHKKAIDECIKMATDESGPITIIHGPPGTGKTTCLAEAIWQIHKHKPDYRILCIGPSHAATDNLCLALGKYFTGKRQLYRYGSISKITDKRVRGHL